MGPDFVLEVYEAPDGWRWRAVATSNGLIVATGAEAYSSKAHGERAVDRFLGASLGKAF